MRLVITIERLPCQKTDAEEEKVTWSETIKEVSTLRENWINWGT